MSGNWGADWRQRFQRFDPTSLAAASIGQVHRAIPRDGRDLAIKVQYPGVAESIDADVDNVATLLRVSGILSPKLDIAPLIEEAKRQLREEAGYAREGEQMRRFGALLGDTSEFVVPTLDAEFTTDRVLAMSYISGDPIESLVSAPQDTRATVMRALIGLVLRELFEFGLMQTDPNFANYRYQPDSGRLVLLDFGAVRPVAAATAQGYRDLLRAGLAGNREAVRDAAVAAGFLGEAAVARHHISVDAIIDVVVAEFNRPGIFDFGDRAFVGALREQGTAIAADRETWHVPPVDTLFAQRKISGTALLAARLKARVDVRSMITNYADRGNVAAAPSL